MCVYLGCAKTAMAEEFLDAADVGAGIEQVRGETVADRVRAGSRVESGLSEVLFQQSADAARGQAGPVFIDKQRRGF